MQTPKNGFQKMNLQILKLFFDYFIKMSKHDPSGRWVASSQTVYCGNQTKTIIRRIDGVYLFEECNDDEYNYFCQSSFWWEGSKFVMRYRYYFFETSDGKLVMDGTHHWRIDDLDEFPPGTELVSEDRIIVREYDETSTEVGVGDDYGKKRPYNRLFVVTKDDKGPLLLRWLAQDKKIRFMNINQETGGYLPVSQVMKFDWDEITRG